MPVSSSLPNPDGSALSEADRRALARFVEQSLGHGFRLAIVEAANHADREDILADVAATIGPGLLRLAIDKLPGADTNLWKALQGPFASHTPHCLALWGLDSGAGTDWARQLNVQRDLFVRDFAVPWLLFIHPASRVPLMQTAPDFCDFAMLWLRDDRQPSAPEVSTDMQTQDGVLSFSDPNVHNPLLLQAQMALDAARFDEARDALSRFSLQPGQDILDRARHQLFSARLEQEQGHLSLAEAFVRDARNMLERHSSTPAVQVVTRLAEAELGIILLQSGRYEEAETVLRRMLPLVEETLGREHLDYGALLNNLAYTLERQGKHSEAERVIRDALSILANAVGREHPTYGNALTVLANVLSAQSKYFEAEQVIRESLAIKGNGIGREHPDYSGSLHALGRILANQGKYAEAMPILRDSIASFERTLGHEHPDYSASLHNLAITLARQGNYGEAESLLRETVALGEKVLGRGHPEYAVSLNSLAHSLTAQGKYGEAEHLFREALSLLEKALGNSHRRLYPTLVGLAMVASSQGRVREGIRFLERALRISETTLGADHPDVGQIRSMIKDFQRSRLRR